MAFDFNPITGQLDLVGGGSSYIDGVVADSSLLPVTLGTPALDAVYLAKAGSGVWLINRKPAGLYVRVANNGVAADWQYLGAFPEVNADGNWALYNSATPSKELKFDLSGITTGTTRTLTAPNASGTIARTEDFASPPAIGNTTPNSGAFTTLAANNGTLTASAPVLDLAQTWNNAAVAFTGVNIAITESAFTTGSRFFDVKTGATSIFSLRNFNGNGAAEVLGIQGPSRGFIFGPQTTNTSGGFFSLRWQLNIAGLARDAVFAWGTDVYGLNYDLAIQRDAANTLAQRRGTNPQTFRLYNTFTSATNFERLNVRWASNELIIDAEAGSAGGTLRGIKIGSATSSLLGFYGVTPVDQPALTADLLDSLQELGLVASGSGDTPLNLSGGTLTAGNLVLTDNTGSETATFDAQSKLTANRTYDLPDASGVIALTNQIPAVSKTYAVFAATDNQPPASNYATLDTRNSIAVLDFDDATDESAVFVSIIPEGASLGSGLKIRLHWMATTATSGDVVWDVSLERMNTDLDSDSFDTIASGTAAANGTSGILTVTEITLTTIDSVTAGDGFRLKVTRDANNASDTMTGDAELVVCEVRSAA